MYDAKKRAWKICLSSHGINAAASQLTVAVRLEEEYLEDRWVGGGEGGFWAYREYTDVLDKGTTFSWRISYWQSLKHIYIYRCYPIHILLQLSLANAATLYLLLPKTLCVLQYSTCKAVEVINQYLNVSACSFFEKDGSSLCLQIYIYWFSFP